VSCNGLSTTYSSVAMWLRPCYEGVARLLGWLLGPSGRFLWHFLGDWWSTAKLELGVLKALVGGYKLLIRSC